MTTLDVRAIATEATSRGWLRPDDLWEIAFRGGREVGSEHRVLSGKLDPARLRSLTTELAETTALADAAATLTARATANAVAVAPSAAEQARYEIGSLLGSGGAGQVNSAIDRQAHRVVALKTLKTRVH